MFPSTCIIISPNGDSRIVGIGGPETMKEKPGKIQEVTIEPIRPLFSLRRLAEYFDCYTEDGKPATDTILEWWHSGRIPPPDMRISRKAVYWRPETIQEFIRNGGSA